MVPAMVAAVSRAALRRRSAVLLIGLLVTGWLLECLRLCCFPPAAGMAPQLYDLHGLGAALNAVLLVFLGVWLWRGARWATWFAALTLLADALVVLQPTGAGLEAAVLLLTIVDGLLVASLLAFPEPLPAT